MPIDSLVVHIAVIGGSGLYQLDEFEVVEEITPQTPWGEPSSPITIVRTLTGQHVAFLARHGRGHIFNPSEVPFRANIAALKSLGVRSILAFSAVGSLQEEIRPGDFVLPSQLIDRTKGIRASTFFEKGAPGHAPFADPFHSGLADLIKHEVDTALPTLRVHCDKTLVCIEGPTFSTRAESKLYRSWDCDIVNMSAVPESKLAREAEIAYQMICMSTDYDCWRVGGEDVTVQGVMEVMSRNVRSARTLLTAIIPPLENAIIAELATTDANTTPKTSLLGSVQGCMRHACMAKKEAIPAETHNALHYILPEYF